MPANEPSDRPGPQAPWRFASTRWSIVAAAGQGSSPQAQEALATLCRLYWYPLYAYARRRLASVEDAQDLTQEFFPEFLEKAYLQPADPGPGKFPSFPFTPFKHFLSKARDRANPRNPPPAPPIFSFHSQALSTP